MVSFSATAVAVATATSMVATPAMATSRDFSQITSRLLKDDARMIQRHDTLRNWHEAGWSPSSLRRLEDSDFAVCDTTFLDCLGNAECLGCFAELQKQSIDWTGVTPDTQCSTVLDILKAAGHCAAAAKSSEASTLFCKTFNACVVWDDEDDFEDDDESEEEVEGWINCTALTSCTWDGFRPTWIGDGICNENMHGCYNTAICGWDGGDCCADTCEEPYTDFKKCGHEGFACRDPISVNCDSRLSSKCQETPAPAPRPECKDGQKVYRLILQDSFGDGWDDTTLTITKTGTSEEVFKGSLKDGFESTEYICLDEQPACYDAITAGGSWGVEVSWDVKTTKESSISLAGAGAPSRCQFPIAGGSCEQTCTGNVPMDPEAQKDYKTLKTLEQCIESKCMIQLGVCKENDICNRCFVEEAPDYCYGVDSFTALIDCTMCKCTGREDSDFCQGGSDSDGKQDNDNSLPQSCSSAEAMKCVDATMQFQECSTMDARAMAAQYDQNNFGELDLFESCSHSYNDENGRGSHKALSCMNMLYNAMVDPAYSEDNREIPVEAIGALARSLYENAESFCDCAKESSEMCTLCPEFMNFKSLMYESLDACVALDQIDCPAWQEFAPRCKSNMKTKFGKAEFTKDEHCKFVKQEQCGGVGAFPVFRRLDCQPEVDADSWSFYLAYANNCLSDGGSDRLPTAKPASSPTPSPSSGGNNAPSAKPAPTHVPYLPNDDDTIRTSTPYVPADERGSGKSKSHWFRNLILMGLLGGGGYYLYKKRFDDFNFLQFRRVRHFGYSMQGGDAGGLYTNLNASTTFEPPTLPPTPQMMGGGAEPMYNGPGPMFNNMNMFGGGGTPDYNMGGQQPTQNYDYSGGAGGTEMT
eukprot:Nitzschia sp. Nitz4//scaffold119_size111653//57707//60550//NITZ4_004193-RA/size111653-processed-gene-0.189-mRNA-1//-1//CDS//3329533845//6002//frame0